LDGVPILQPVGVALLEPYVDGIEEREGGAAAAGEAAFLDVAVVALPQHLCNPQERELGERGTLQRGEHTGGEG
jgi:hypothetical protein